MDEVRMPAIFIIVWSVSPARRRLRTALRRRSWNRRPGSPAASSEGGLLVKTPGVVLYPRIAVAFLLLVLQVASSPSAVASTTVPGGIVANQTWTAAGSPYLVQGDVTIPAGGQLTIEPGKIVQMASTDAQVAGCDASRVEITVKGTLNINGSGAAPVTLEAQTGTS